MKKGIVCLMFLCFVVVGKPQTSSARSPEITISSSDTDVVANVRLGRRSFRKAIDENRGFMVQAWVRDVKGWTRLGLYPMEKHRFVRSFDKQSICGRSCCPKRIAVQVGMWQEVRGTGRRRPHRRRPRGRRRIRQWWNARTSDWQLEFVSLEQRILVVDCDSTPDDPPPGTIIVQTTAPPPRRVEPQPVHVEPPHEDPPIRVVAPDTVGSFLRSLKNVAIESNRLKMLRGWVSGLRGLKVDIRDIARVLKLFTFDSNRVEVARIMARHVFEPFTVKDLNRLLRHFSHDSNRYKAAAMYCKGIDEPLDAHHIGRVFSFDSYKRKITSHCR